jgi:hypothetical protein
MVDLLCDFSRNVVVMDKRLPADLSGAEQAFTRLTIPISIELADPADAEEVPGCR